MLFFAVIFYTNDNLTVRAVGFSNFIEISGRNGDVCFRQNGHKTLFVWMISIITFKMLCSEFDEFNRGTLPFPSILS